MFAFHLVSRKNACFQVIEIKKRYLTSDSYFWAVEGHLVSVIYFLACKLSQNNDSRVLFHSVIQSFIQKLLSTYCVSYS